MLVEPCLVGPRVIHIECVGSVAGDLVPCLLAFDEPAQPSREVFDQCRIRRKGAENGKCAVLVMRRQPQWGERATCLLDGGELPSIQRAKQRSQSGRVYNRAGCLKSQEFSNKGAITQAGFGVWLMQCLVMHVDL